MKTKIYVISLGGSLIVPDAIDVAFLKQFKKIILNFTKKDNRIIVICGGGSTVRRYNLAAKMAYPGVTPTDLDWMGIAITYANALLVRNIFGNAAEEKILRDPTRKINSKKKIIIGCGWKPGCSTDKDAVLAAKAYGIKTLVNLSDIAHICDKDPRKYKNAKPYKHMAWKELREIVGNVWHPGAHVPFDPVAAKLAQRWKQKLAVMNGKDLTNFENFLRDIDFRGTVVDG